MTLIQPVKTGSDCAALFQKFAHQPYAFFLDSSMNPKGLGAFSFMGANPYLIFKSKGNEVTLWQEGVIKTFHTDPLTLLQDILKKELYTAPSDNPIPFLGGGVGYMAYDAYPLFEPIAQTKPDALGLPDIFWGFYDGILAFDNRTQETFAIASERCRSSQETLQSLQAIIQSPVLKENVSSDSFTSTNTPKKPLRFLSNFEKSDYLETINKVKARIARGDIYQVNLSQQFHCFCEADPITVFNILRKQYPAPFGAYLECGDFQIISNSPERFFKVENGRIETRPIKGTRPRGNSLAEDNRLKKSLIESEKEKAELLMIVDLERNDLARIAKTGSVTVEEMFEVESYPTVFHLVSTIQARLKERVDSVSCFRALFPGGSITGAPKIRSIEIIDELEPVRRGIYTGAIGYISVNGVMDMNIAIRTLIHKDQRYTFNVGGGIVWDSVASEEYEETLHKARALMSAIEQANKNKSVFVSDREIRR